MALYRTINMQFWTDTKIADDFSPEDKFFFLYLLTNPHTNLCGCYEISIKQMADETGYAKETVEKLIHRLEEYAVARYEKESKEIIIWNWRKYNWTASDKFVRAVQKEIGSIKCVDFREHVEHWLDTLTNSDNDTASAHCEYPIDTSDTDTISDANANSNYSNEIKEIINYLNRVLGTKYTYRCEANNKHIRARLAEGHTVEEFKRVIDNKHTTWGSDVKMSKYLRPETLFGTKFESYLNEKGVKSNGNVKYDAREIYGADLYDKPDDGNDMPFM